MKVRAALDCYHCGVPREQCGHLWDGRIVCMKCGTEISKLEGVFLFCWACARSGRAFDPDR